jgi:2,3-dihydroxy-p-cumate/2,3-dihydroxybenzoate 3,4-dioxygenase
MIKHMVAFRFRSGVSEDDQARLLAELDDLPRRFSAMKRWSLGRNISRRDDTFTHGFTVEFDTEEELIAYLGSEAHERFVTQRFRPLIQQRAIVSLSV